MSNILNLPVGKINYNGKIIEIAKEEPVVQEDLTDDLDWQDSLLEELEEAINNLPEKEENKQEVTNE